jgi:hypothetical protein
LPLETGKMLVKRYGMVVQQPKTDPTTLANAAKVYININAKIINLDQMQLGVTDKT